MRTVEREALILDRAIDLMIVGGEVVDDSRVREAAGLLAAMESMPTIAGRERARRRMLAPTPRSRRTWLRWVAAVPAAAVLALGGVAYAARDAKPGDILYGIRRAEEASRLALVGGHVAHAEARLARASDDLNDARDLFTVHRMRDALHALDLFDRDLGAAKSEITKLPTAERLRLTARADAMDSDADTLRAWIDSTGLGEGQGSGTSDDEHQERQERDERRGQSGEGSEGSDPPDTGAEEDPSTRSDESGSKETSGESDDAASGSDDADPDREGSSAPDEEPSD